MGWEPHMRKREVPTVLHGRRDFGAAGRAAPAKAVGTGLSELWAGISVLGGVRTSLMKGSFIPSHFAVLCASSLGPLSSPSAPPGHRHCRMPSWSHGFAARHLGPACFWPSQGISLQTAAPSSQKI